MPRPGPSDPDEIVRARSTKGRPAADPAAASPPSEPPAPNRTRLLVLAAFAVVAMAAGFVLWLDLSAKDSFGCTSATVPAGSVTGATARQAVDAYLASATLPAGTPRTGWEEREPNRWAVLQGADQWVIVVTPPPDRSRPDQPWTVQSFDHCGPT